MKLIKVLNLAGTNAFGLEISDEDYLSLAIAARNARAGDNIFYFIGGANFKVLELMGDVLNHYHHVCFSEDIKMERISYHDEAYEENRQRTINELLDRSNYFESCMKINRGMAITMWIVAAIACSCNIYLLMK